MNECIDNEISIGVAKKWREYSIDCSEASGWISAGYDISSALKCKLDTEPFNLPPKEISKWNNYGFSCDDIRSFYNSYVYDINEAFVWRKLGINFDKIKNIKAKGLSFSEFYKCRNMKVDDINDCILWLKINKSGEDIISLIKEGINATEANEWLKANYSISDIKKMKGIGIGFFDAEKWRKRGFLTDDVIKFKNEGIDIECASYWKDCGLKDEIIEWKKVGFYICSDALQKTNKDSRKEEKKYVDYNLLLKSNFKVQTYNAENMDIISCSDVQRIISYGLSPDDAMRIYSKERNKLESSKVYNSLIEKYNKLCMEAYTKLQKLNLYEVYGQVSFYDPNKKILILENGSAYEMEKILNFLDRKCIVIADYHSNGFKDYLSFIQNGLRYYLNIKEEYDIYGAIYLYNKRFYINTHYYLGTTFVPEVLGNCYFFSSKSFLLKKLKFYDEKEKLLNNLAKFKTEVFPNLWRKRLDNIDCPDKL